MDVILSLLLQHCGALDVPAKQLAKQIVHSAREDALLIAKIIVIESNCNSQAWNSKSNDHGLLQLSHRLAASKGLTGACLYDWRCNLKQSVLHLQWLKERPGFRPCMYNLGPTGAKRYTKTCEAYENKLRRIR